MDFSQMVKTARKASKMSQEDLARALHVSFATINRWENGKTRPNQLTREVFFAFCQERGIRLENSNDTEE